MTKPRPTTSPCGIPIPTLDEFAEEYKVEWRNIKIGETAQTTLYYNTHKQICEKGILKVWTKSVQKDTLVYAIDRLEVNCRADQTRLMSSIKYQKDGVVMDSIVDANSKWRDVVPDSIAERLLETVCRKTL